MLKISVLTTALLLASCHAAPAFASGLDADELLRSDAYAVCKTAGMGDSEECVDILADSYLDAMVEGAHDGMAGFSFDTKYLVAFAYSYTGCKTTTSKSCEQHVVNWASWFRYGEKNVKTNPIMQKELKTYFNEVK